MKWHAVCLLLNYTSYKIGLHSQHRQNIQSLKNSRFHTFTATLCRNQTTNTTRLETKRLGGLKIPQSLEVNKERKKVV